MREAHRATEFARACRRLKIRGITLHSYRYSWAERAKTAAYPERYAQEALGHNSKAVHRAYSKHAQVVIPALDEYEKKLAAASRKGREAIRPARADDGVQRQSLWRGAWGRRKSPKPQKRLDR